MEYECRSVNDEDGSHVRGIVIYINLINVILLRACLLSFEYM